MDITNYQSAFLKYLQNQSFQVEPLNLYQPVDYILNIGGKRIRPVLVLMATDIFSDNYEKALPAALAIEMFHNFTLVHDDIMDEAPLRRGEETVHKKWNTNTAILSGDVMQILAYRYFDSYEPNVFKKLVTLFSKTAIEVCEGQQLDVDFETRNDVTIDEYIKMITLKTSVLVATALKMGTIIADVNEEQQELIYKFGLNLGIAFQLQDDYLDTFGDAKTFGKQIGGDIIENKKTFLYLKALEVASQEDKKILLNLYAQKTEGKLNKIKIVTEIFRTNNIPTIIKEEIGSYTLKAFTCLEELEISSEKIEGLKNFGKGLMNRMV